MTRVGIIVKEGKKEAITAAKKLSAWLRSHRLEPIAAPPLARALGLRRSHPLHTFPHMTDLLVVLGGDGTLLSAARLVKGHNIPILGVNLGGLGFLTAVSLDELLPTMANIAAGRVTVEQRMTLHTAILRKGKIIGEYGVLNDAVINKGAMARIIHISAEVNGEFLTSFRADGIILSSPTGSTAYSLSAGGPIIVPSLNCIIVTPICPHTLTNRPLVVPEASRIRLTLTMKDEDVYLTLDGQVGHPLRNGDIVEVSAGSDRVHLVQSPSRDYFRILREKLAWGQQ